MILPHDLFSSCTKYFLNISQKQTPVKVDLREIFAFEKQRIAQLITLEKPITINERYGGVLCGQRRKTMSKKRATFSLVSHIFNRR